jgi:hypothetical protein
MGRQPGQWRPPFVLDQGPAEQGEIVEVVVENPHTDFHRCRVG